MLTESWLLSFEIQFVCLRIYVHIKLWTSHSEREIDLWEQTIAGL